MSSEIPPDGRPRGAVSSDIAKVAELLKQFRIAMLITEDGQGCPISRPMAVQEVEFDGDLWFFAARDSRKVAHVRARPQVCVALSSHQSWVSLSGTAEIVEDVAKSRELWNSAVQAWFPEGPDDDNIVLIKVHADGAEYWDSPGSRIATVIGYAKSRLTGKRPDLGENERVEL